MLRRTLVGATSVAVLLAAWWIDQRRPGQPAWAMATLGLVVVLGALHELLAMGKERGAVQPVAMAAGVVWVVLVGTAGLPAGVLPPPLDGLRGLPLAGPLLIASVLCSVMLAARLFAGPGQAVTVLARNPLFALAYTGGLAALLYALLAGRLSFVLGLVLTVKSSDVGAYFAGKFLGKRKLAPRISPGKTVAGAVGGVVLPALLAVWLLSGVEVTLPLHEGRAVHLPHSVPALLLLGAACGAAAIVSDLCESLVKRSLGCKDSGTLFGESGGFLDLADSLLLVAPSALAYTALLA